MAKNIIILILIIVLIAIIYQLFFNSPPTDTLSINIKGTDFQLEVARTIPQKSRGLMNRTSLTTDGGMIFISDFEMPQIFWMKNTLIPLDMIFLNKNGQVINILTATPEPNIPDTQLTLHRSSAPAKYVIELNAGTADKLNLLPGDILKI